MIIRTAPAISIVAEDEAGTIEGATLNIGTSLTLDYYATFTGEAEGASMRFTSSSGRVTVVEGAFDEAQQMYKFSYTGINPQCMTDTIDAELMYNGTVLDTKEDYSVKAYCDNLAVKNASELNFTSSQHQAFRELMADMLVYGKVSQQYKGYNVEMLADTSTWVAIYTSTFAKPNGVRNVLGNTDADNRVTALGVNIANVNKIYFKFKLTDENVIVKLNDNVVNRYDLVKIDENSYVYYTNDSSFCQSVICLQVML